MIGISWRYVANGLIFVPPRPAETLGRPGSLERASSGFEWVNEPRDPVARCLRSGHPRSFRAESGFDYFRQDEIR
jgi:hypothetical protein